MAKIITIDRKYIAMVAGFFVICLLGFAGFSLWENKNEGVTKNMANPEIKMIGVTVEPTSIVKDLTYGSVTLKGAQVITTKTFDLIVTVQNMTAKKMSNVPVELQVSIIGDDTKKVSTPGSLEVLEPGATARIAFRKISVLGDALGKSATDGQHLITLRVNPNPEGGVEQATEASFRFNVDTTVKAPPTVKKQ